MIRPTLCALVLALAAGAAQAQTSPFALTANAGTTGLGVEAQIQLGPIFVVRGGVDMLAYDTDQTFDDVRYGADLDFDTAGAFIDLHPLANGFMISGGAYLGDRSIGLDATPSAPVNIGGQTYTPSQVGTLSGKVELSDVAPFLGLGYDNTFTRPGRWGFRAIAGVAWSENPKVDLDASGGSLSNDPTFRARLREEAQEIEKDAEDYGVFPVAQVGLALRF